MVDVNEYMSKPLLLTCHHVIPSKEVAKNCSVWFDRLSSNNPGTEVKGADLFDLDRMFVTHEVHISLCGVGVTTFMYINNIEYYLLTC